MKSFRNWARLCAAVAGTLVLHGELGHWMQHIEAGSLLDAIFFRTVTLPGGTVASRKPPRETIPELTKAIAASASPADLLALRAQESEQQLDFKSAEADWQAYARQASDRLAGLTALADFYYRRLQPKEEFTALLEAASQPLPPRERFTSDLNQRSWQLFERAARLIEAQSMGFDMQAALYKAWMARYPQNQDLYARYAGLLTSAKRYAEAESVAAAFTRAFPSNLVIPVRIRAAIEESRSSPEKARAVYDSAFQASWPPELIADYFELLKRSRGLRAFLASARSAAAANPLAVEPATRIFFYYQQAGDLGQAHRALLEYRLRKQARSAAWTADELLTLARLFEATHNYPEAARHFHECNVLAGLSPAAAEEALAGVIRVLFTAPEQPIRIGTGDLSYYRDIATVDPYPGFFNGILSLLYNASNAQGEYADQERAAVPYFHRAKAAELLAEFDKRFPASAHRPALHAKLIGAYAEYGENNTVIGKGRQYLTSFPKGSERTAVALHIADAYARQEKLQEEFAAYDALLKELGAAAAGMPLGTASGALPRPSSGDSEDDAPRYRPAPANRSPVRSPDYARVLERYLARLTSMKRITQAITVYRGEIDRNPDDPALYDRLAQFLDQNRRGVEIEAVYTRAAKQFQDRNWYHKLARWYLRQKQRAQFEKLTQEVARIFSGTDLEKYFEQVVASGGVDSALYRQVNLYAHQRFPHDLLFVKNLVEVYARKETLDQQAAERLLRNNWYYDADLRSRFFELLSRTGRLKTEIAAMGSLPATALADRAATQFISEAQSWMCHFEAGAPSMQMIANNYPGDTAVNNRAASIFRSLGQIDAAARFAGRITRIEPRNLEARARIGDIYADREQFDRARPVWNELTTVEPGKSAGYLEAATVYWDYFLYDDALRIIDQGRAKMQSPSLLAFEAGAIYEGKRDFARAIGEYVKGAMAEPGSAAERRLLRLASRPAHRNAIESATSALANAPSLDTGAYNLRVAILEEQNRRDELAAYLTATAARTSNFELLASIETTASNNDLHAVRLRVIERQIALTPDPVERVRLRLDSAKLLESRGDIKAAEQIVAAVLKENPALLGVIRSATDFYWRNKQGMRAVDTLEQSAARANADYRRRFLLEAARKATEAGQAARARKTLDPLLSAEPAAADIITLYADTYASAGDDAGVRAFLTAKLKETRGETQARLRRTLVPVMVRLKDFAGAVDQYIEVLNRYPDDRALIQEVAAFARRHNQAERLGGYYAKAASDSPRDARWPAVLARLNVHFEKLAEAAATYTQALAIRPDRTDLLEERARAEERLLRFDEASKSYARLYELAHRNPHWMAKSAEARARLGDKDGALKALRTAFLENVRPRAAEYFELARTLEEWNWLAEAKQFADQGLKEWQPATDDAVDQLGAYIRLHTRLRQYDSAWAAVSPRLPEGSPQRVLSIVAQTVRTYFTPEEKSAFARFLQSTGVENRAQIAQAAGLADVAVRAMHEEFTNNPASAAEGGWQRLAQLQQRRMQYSELAYQLETYWKALPFDNPGRPQLLKVAAAGQRIAGNPKDELRLLGLLEQTGALSGPAAERYAELLRTTAPARLLELAAKGSTNVRDAAARAALGGSDADLALKAVAARGTGLTPLWTNAFTALTGLHFARTTPDIATAFQTILGPRTVGEQLAARPDGTTQLNGDAWFPYAARYGEFLALSQHPEFEDFVVAELEQRPFGAHLYLELGDWYLERKAHQTAIAEYEHALQLDPKEPSVHDRIAGVLASQGKLGEAQARWRTALEGWQAMQAGRLPDHFWSGVQSTFANLGKYKSLAPLRTEAEAIVRTYLRRTGQFRANEILRAAFSASEDPVQGMSWVVELARSAGDRGQLLGELVDEAWIPDTGRDQLFRLLLQVAENEVARMAGQNRNEALWNLRNRRMQWVRRLLDTKRGAEAWKVLQTLDAEARQSMRYEMLPLEIRAAEAAGTLDSLLARYRSDAGEPPSTHEIRRAAESLRASGAAEAARKVLEYLYTRELESAEGSPLALLGMAELRLESGDVAGAMALLRRLNLSVGEPFEHLAASASLLERSGRRSEAIETWRDRVRAVPWDTASASALARLTSDAQTSRRLAADAATPYASRVEVARTLSGTSGLGSRELDLLASGGTIAPQDAEAAYFFRARLRAAEQTTDGAARVRLLRGALSIEPEAMDARAQLFRAAVDAGMTSTSIAAWYPLLAQSAIGHWLTQTGTYSGRVDYMAEQFLSGAALSPADRFRAARDLAAAFRKLDQLGAAGLMLRIAQQLDPRADVSAEVAALQAELEMREENRKRMPLIGNSPAQPNRVKPRLVAQGGAQ